jgi:hypothetical protein
MTIPTTGSAIASAQAILEAIAQETDMARALQDGSTAGRMLARQLPASTRQNIIRSQIVTHTWRKIGRQVLAMHPAVVEEVTVASSDKVPGEVLRTLPYMNPMVVYADPPTFDTWVDSRGNEPRHSMTRHDYDPFANEAKLRLLGFICYGASNALINEPALISDQVSPAVRLENRIHSTTDANAERFGMLLVLEVLDVTGRVITTELDNISVFFDKTLTLSEMVDDVLGRFHWDTSSNRHSTRERRWMRQLLSTVIGSLFYLCSTTLEAEKVPPKAVTKAMSRKIERKPLSFYKVGWTMGAALTRYRRSRPPGWKESDQADITHQQDPQHRKAHFKMQPYGPGSSLRKLIFVSAYWTHLERLGEVGVNVARRVPLTDGQGAAAEATRRALEMADVDPEMVKAARAQ